MLAAHAPFGDPSSTARIHRLKSGQYWTATEHATLTSKDVLVVALAEVKPDPVPGKVSELLPTC